MFGSPKEPDASPSTAPSESRDKNLDPAAYDNFEAPKSMPHRVEPMSTSQPQPAHPYAPPPAATSKQRRSPYERPAGRASPPPIATLPGSPTPPDRSAVSTPPVRRPSPPPAHQQQQQHAPPPPPPHHYAAYDMQRYPPGTYMYAPPPPQYAHPHDGHRYDPQQGQPQYAPQPYPGGYVPYPLPGTILSAPTGAPGAPGAAIQIVHTDDAATKLSDRVRRRCFNCCTTDTSTWRRSNLSPGKVLCNKCGLFERTHSRPRPEQFPHKRGPLAASTLRAREPEQGQPQQTYQAYPPPAPGQQHQAQFSGPPPAAAGSSAPQNTASSSSQQQTAPPSNGSAPAANGSASHPGTPNPNTNGAPTTNGASSRPASRGAPASRGRSPE